MRTEQNPIDRCVPLQSHLLENIINIEMEAQPL